jgi:hypothetical protein
MHANLNCLAKIRNQCNKTGKIFLIPEHTHTFFAKSEFLVSNYTNHIVLMYFLSIVNQDGYVIRCVSSVVAYWTESCSSQNIFSFMQQPCFILHYTKITIPMFCMLRKSITIHHCVALLQVVPPHKFVCLPCWHYRF